MKRFQPNFYRIAYNIFHKTVERGGGQHLKQLYAEWAIFQNYKIANIKITKDELFDFFNFEFIFYSYICLNYSNTKIYGNS